MISANMGNKDGIFRIYLYIYLMKKYNTNSM